MVLELIRLLIPALNVLGSSERSLMFAWLTFVDGKTLSAWPSIDSLSRASGLSPRTCQRCLARLSHDWLLPISARTGGVSAVWELNRAKVPSSWRGSSLTSWNHVKAGVSTNEQRQIDVASAGNHATNSGSWRRNEDLNDQDQRIAVLTRVTKAGVEERLDREALINFVQAAAHEHGLPPFLRTEVLRAIDQARRSAA